MLNITQNGVNLSGTWSITYADPANNGTGALTGSATADKVCHLHVDLSTHCDGYRTLVSLTLTSTKTGYPTIYMPNIVVEDPDRKLMRNVRYQNTFELTGWLSMVGDVTLAKQ